MAASLARPSYGKVYGKNRATFTKSWVNRYPTTLPITLRWRLLYRNMLETILIVYLSFTPKYHDKYILGKSYPQVAEKVFSESFRLGL